jgi:hypothetical protein
LGCDEALDFEEASGAMKHGGNDESGAKVKKGDEDERRCYLGQNQTWTK